MQKSDELQFYDQLRGVLSSSTLHLGRCPKQRNLVTMFDISFTQLLVIVTVSGYILGRKDMKRIARVFGGGVGKFVGSVQGMRTKYDQKSQNQNVELKTLHTSVRSGLRGILLYSLCITLRKLFIDHFSIPLMLYPLTLLDQIYLLSDMTC